MKSAFVCWRPFQIFNSINFIYHDFENTKENSDIFILDIQDNVKCLNKLNEVALFKNIYLFKKVKIKNKLKTRVQLFKDYFFPQKAVLRDLIMGKKEIVLDEYDILIGSGFLGFFLYLTEINKNAKIIFLEDGMISYQGDERKLRKETLANVFLSRFFHKGDLCLSIESLYLNNIKLKADEYPYMVKEMPYLDVNTIRLLRYIFDCTKFIPYDKKIIFLDQPLETDSYVLPGVERKILDLLLTIREKIIYRKHPNKTNIPNGFKEEQERIMWEIRASEIDSTNVLIGYFSTAQMTPYIIYEKTPSLIFLYRLVLLKNNSRYNGINNLIMRFKEKYPGEVYIPESLDELLNLIKSL